MGGACLAWTDFIPWKYLSLDFLHNRYLWLWRLYFQKIIISSVMPFVRTTGGSSIRVARLVKQHTHVGPIAHGYWFILVIDMFRDVLAQHSLFVELDVGITVVTLDHTVDDQALQVPIIIISFWIDEEITHDLFLHSTSSILVWTLGIGDILLRLKVFWMHVTTNHLQM